MVFEPDGSLPGTLSMRVFDAPAKLALAVVAALHEAVLTAVRERGRASLVIGGGSLPAACGPRLATLGIPWERVSITLADELLVAADDSRSHARWLAATLPEGVAAAAHFVPLFDPADADPLAAANDRLHAMTRPFDLVLLGVDAQGRIAAPWQGSGATAPAQVGATDPLCRREEPKDGVDPAVPRHCLTLAALLDSRRILIAARGLDRRESFERTLLGHGPEASALDTLAQHAHQPIDFCWCR